MNITCDFSLVNNEWGAVVCRDLGYNGVEKMTYVQESAVEPSNLTVNYENPSCDLDTAETMTKCGILYDVEKCTPEQQVYIKCAGIVLLYIDIEGRLCWLSIKSKHPNISNDIL